MMRWEDGGGRWRAGAEDGVAEVGLAVHAGRQLAATWRRSAAATRRSQIQRGYVQPICCAHTPICQFVTDQVLADGARSSRLILTNLAPAWHITDLCSGPRPQTSQSPCLMQQTALHLLCRKCGGHCTVICAWQPDAKLKSSPAPTRSLPICL